MKTTVFLMMTLAASMFAESAMAQTEPPRRKLPPRVMRPNGGIVFSEATGKHICILNAQSIVPRARLEQGALAVKTQLLSPIEIVDAMGSATLDEKIASAMNNPNVGAMVVFAEDDKLDTMTFSPERSRCIVNVKALAADGADKERVGERAEKEVWRSIGMVLGAGEAMSNYTILRRVTSLKELDEIRVKAPLPEQHNRMIDALGALGIKMVKIASYREACKQGWAPAPTNDVQKAIWDNVHEIPTKPIKIEFDEKRDKGK